MTACFSTRWASFDDLPALRALMTLAIDALQARFLSPEQMAASHAIMGLDTQLVEDGTYLIVERHCQSYRHHKPFLIADSPLRVGGCMPSDIGTAWHGRFC
jgi:hypothetical protein